MKTAVLRPLLHASTGLTLLMALWSWEALRLALTAAAVIAVCLEALRLRNPAFRQWLAARVPVFRPVESARVSGAVWLSLGYAAAVWLPVPAASAAVLTAALADPAGALVGEWLGRSHLKSWPGTTAVGATAAAALYLLGLPWAAVLGGAGVAAAAERWSGPLNDNLAIPVAVGVTVWAMG